MTTSTREYISAADTAKLVRAALKAEFPSTKFSIRSKSYSGGASIRVCWTDGPTESDVSATTSLYTGASFDGMQDLKSYHSSILVDEDGNPREVHFGADYIFTERSFSPEWIAELTELAQQNGRVTRMEQCRRCGNWMQDTDCWTALGEFGTVFTCTAECSARQTARYLTR